MQHHTCKLFVIVTALFSLILCSAPAMAAEDDVITPITLDEVHTLLQSDTPLVISLMTSWCGPCREELPMLDLLYSDYRAQGVEFVGISLDMAQEPMEKMLQEVPVSFPFYWVGESAMEDLEVNAVPQLILVKNGGIVQRLVGLLGEAQLRGLLDDFLKQTG
ncbi:TlpA family protein disulfide reductase [Oceanidesulfovibrio marinus]|uniref:Thioredoxin domain-containing protein n=1 Tax=Oceanidesulfovibrio marinus TaxID=370038 RepID=A0A6P1ZDS2_9BACT|nr:TlpA disulfide reductase family protein [Oceanidesulfovibrio marinus]TVM32604.1 hypothetical protein DQK91_15140 [Oceanidesulfovibrio marinus]